MKKILAAIIILLLFCAAATAQETRVQNIIDKNENWVPKNSPYIIDGEITVTHTGFVTIYPGTTVKFTKGSKLVVYGAFYAKGDPKNPVRFLPDDNTSFYEGIVFKSKYRNRIDFSMMIRGAIVTEGTTLDITNSYILNSTGILVQHFSRVLVKDCYFYNNTYGIYTEGQQAAVNVTGNTFDRNRFAYYVKQSGAEAVNNNNFVNNTVAVTNYSPRQLNFSGNWWGDYQEKNIEKYIYDRRNNAKAGEVVYKPFAAKELALVKPSAAFAQVAKYYLTLKRPDEEIPRFSFGGGMAAVMPFTPDFLKEMSTYGLGMSGSFTITLDGPFFLGVEARMLSIQNIDKSIFDYTFNQTSMYVNGIAYMGLKPGVFFLPYAKLGSGVALLSQQYKYVDSTPTKKINEISYTGQAGLGVEWFFLQFASLRAEALYSFTTCRDGKNIHAGTLNATANIYFDMPVYSVR